LLNDEKMRRGEKENGKKKNKSEKKINQIYTNKEQEPS
jgi:hypothetical protein